ncbi:FUSC family protein [Acetobacter sp.]|uniref:FUSC family protein n=1 Tax=Acetobacter sp. TaxID=440 RepID=UPI0039E90561
MTAHAVDRSGRFLSAIVDECRREWLRVQPTALYAGRVFLAIGLALWLAGFLMLDNPVSAVTTVLIVANPTPGALISKSIWRIIGTLVGTTLGIALMACFPQQPTLFFCGLSVLIGLACFVATLLRFYRAYAAVLTGYTIIIISTSAFENPDHIFESAMARLSVVVLGIISTAFVFQITTLKSPNTASARIEQYLRDVLAQFAFLTAAELQSATPRPDEAGQAGAFRAMETVDYSARGRLLAQANAVIEAIDYASSVDWEVNRRAAALHEGVGRLMGLLSTHHAASRNIPPGDAGQVRAAREISGQLIRELADMPMEQLLHGDSQLIRARISKAVAKLEHLAREAPDLAGLAAVDTERDIVTQLGQAVDNLSDIAWHEKGVRLLPLIEWPAALRNMARGALVALIGCLTWYILHWSAGPSALVFLICASCLLSTAPSATKASWFLASGTALAVPACFIFRTFFLPQTDGFPLLWLSLFVCLLPGIWIQFHPKYAVMGFGYAVFFNVMSQVNNPVPYHDIPLLNSWFAFLIACVGLVLVFRVILPADQRLDVARLITALCRSVQGFAALPLRYRVSWPSWEYHQMQRVLRMQQRLSFVEGSHRVFHVTDAALAAVALGRSVMRLRWLLREDGNASPEQERIVEDALAALKDLRRDPIATACRLREAAKQLLPDLRETGGPAEAGGNQETEGNSRLGTVRRMAACLVQAAQLIDAAPGFFHKGGPMQQAADHPFANADLRLFTMPNATRPVSRAA